MIDQGKTMKFRDPKTGEVFEDIFDARERFCGGKDCNTCVMPNACRENLPDDSCTCCDFAMKHPAEAARLMGYEVVEEAATGETHRGKPRICEVLGVEVGEQFGISTMPGVVFWICEDGTFDTCPGGAPKSVYHFLRAVEHPDRILRKPRFTQEEVALLRTLYAAGARWLARGDKHLRWYAKRPYQRAEDNKWDMHGDWGTMSGKLPAKLFPSLLPGTSISVKEVVGEDN